MRRKQERDQFEEDEDMSGAGRAKDRGLLITDREAAAERVRGRGEMLFRDPARVRRIEAAALPGTGGLPQKSDFTSTNFSVPTIGAMPSRQNSGLGMGAPGFMPGGMRNFNPGNKSENDDTNGVVNYGFQLDQLQPEDGQEASYLQARAHHFIDCRPTNRQLDRVTVYNIGMFAAVLAKACANMTVPRRDTELCYQNFCTWSQVESRFRSAGDNLHRERNDELSGTQLEENKYNQTFTQTWWGDVGHISNPLADMKKSYRDQYKHALLWMWRKIGERKFDDVPEDVKAASWYKARKEQDPKSSAGASRQQQARQPTSSSSTSSPYVATAADTDEEKAKQNSLGGSAPHEGKAAGVPDDGKQGRRRGGSAVAPPPGPSGAPLDAQRPQSKDSPTTDGSGKETKQTFEEEALAAMAAAAGGGEKTWWVYGWVPVGWAERKWPEQYLCDPMSYDADEPLAWKENLANPDDMKRACAQPRTGGITYLGTVYMSDHPWEPRLTPRHVMPLRGSIDLDKPEAMDTVGEDHIARAKSQKTLQSLYKLPTARMIVNHCVPGYT